MADFFVKNLSNPVPSTNDLGVHVQPAGNSPADAFAAYAALHPVSNGEQLRCVPANTVTIAVAAPGPQVFNASALTLPPVGA